MGISGRAHIECRNVAYMLNDQDLQGMQIHKQKHSGVHSLHSTFTKQPSYSQCCPLAGCNEPPLGFHCKSD